MAELIVYERNMLYAPCASAVAGEHDLLDSSHNSKQKTMNSPKSAFRIMIPTRDSARWIAAMLHRYRALGEEPLFICDTRSVDDTRRLLDELGAEVHECTPSADFAEAGMIEFGSRASGASWILRLDDDEFPTRPSFGLGAPRKCRPSI